MYYDQMVSLGRFSFKKTTGWGLTDHYQLHLKRPDERPSYIVSYRSLDKVVKKASEIDYIINMMSNSPLKFGGVGYPSCLCYKNNLGNFHIKYYMLDANFKWNISHNRILYSVEEFVSVNPYPEMTKFIMFNWEDFKKKGEP